MARDLEEHWGSVFRATVNGWLLDDAPPDAKHDSDQPARRHSPLGHGRLRTAQARPVDDRSLFTRGPRRLYGDHGHRHPTPESAPRRRAAPGPTLVLFVATHARGRAPQESRVAWVRVTRKRQLRVVDVEASSNPEVVELLDISVVPALALLNDGRVVGRLEGRATGDQIEELIRNTWRKAMSSSTLPPSGRA